jgi:hypothetical protein
MSQEPQGISDLEPFIIALQKIGHQDLAIQCLDAFAESATLFGQHDNLSKCYFKIKEYKKSIKHGKESLTVAPSAQHVFVTRNNLINVYNSANMPEEAMTYIGFNEGAGSSGEIELHKSYALYLLNRKPEAQKILENVLLSDNIPEEIRDKIEFNLGTYYLYEDKFQKGMRQFLLGGAKMKLWNTQTIFARNNALNLPFWQGSPDVKNLVVYAEAGIGDEIINIRFMNHLKERGINAYWYEATQKNKKNDRQGLTDLFVKNGYPVIQDLEEVLHMPDIMWTYSMQLPIYLNLGYADLWKEPYLKPCPEFQNKWKIDTDKPKIGIRWKGSKNYEQDLHRSYPVSQLYSNIGHIDAHFISLQRDDGVEETVDFPNVVDYSDKLETIEDTFALISNLDIVITSCTSIAHMAASQGKKVYVFVPISAYYTWCHSTEKTPWYGENVTLLRQTKPRNWDEPMAKLKDLLGDLN